MTFANPGYFLLILPVVGYIVWYLLRNDRSEPDMQVSTTSMYASLPQSPLTWLRHLPFVLRVAGLVPHTAGSAAKSKASTS